jgi:Fe-S-cluster-containing dehydrogenase component
VKNYVGNQLINVDECIGCHACEVACKIRMFPKEIMVHVVSVE